MKHTHQIKSYTATHRQLAEDIGDLYYDTLADFLRLMAEKVDRDAQADAGRGRHKLATQLAACAEHLQQAAGHIDVAWKICAPHVAVRQEKQEAGN